MLTFSEMSAADYDLLAARWLSLDAHQRERAARRLQSTVGTIERHLQMWRKFRQLTAAESQARVDTILEEDEPEPLPAPETPPAPQATLPHVGMRAAVFDLECTDFGTDGYAGLLVCCSVLPLDTGEVYTLKLRFDEHTDDRRLVREVVNNLAQYDILIGHNVAAFDFNWLYSRWLYHNVRGSDVGDWHRWLYFDTYQSVKVAALKTRKSLGNLGAYFGLAGVKTVVYKAEWNQIRSPYEDEWREAMDSIVYHCEQDVALNRRLFDAIWGSAKSRNACPIKQTKWAYTPGNVPLLPAIAGAVA
jgi:hypothetical protein